MNARERFQAVLNFERPDRQPVIEWASWWKLTLDRWRAEGLDPALEGVELQRYFGLDLMVQEWVSPRAPHCPPPPAHGAPIVADEEEYEALKSSGALYDLGTATRWPNFTRYAEDGASGAAVFWFTLEGFFWVPRTLLGIEPHLYAFYDRPELMKRINQDQVEFSFRVLERLFARFRPAFMTFAEDMSYNHGPMISEALFDEFMLPCYRQLVPFIQAHGVKVFVDSDGDVTPCIPWFRRAGIDGVLPLERQAGVDVAAVRERFRDFLLLGAFDKMVMHRGEAALRGEFERLLPVVRTGGLLVGCDHQTPPGVSLADYRLYLELSHEYAVRR